MSLLVHLLLLKGASDWNAAGCWRILALRWHVMLAVLMLQNETKCQHYTRDITTGASIFVGGSLETVQRVGSTHFQAILVFIHYNHGIPETIQNLYREGRNLCPFCR